SFGRVSLLSVVVPLPLRQVSFLSLIVNSIIFGDIQELFGNKNCGSDLRIVFDYQSISERLVIQTCQIGDNSIRNNPLESCDDRAIEDIGKPSRVSGCANCMPKGQKAGQQYPSG